MCRLIYTCKTYSLTCLAEQVGKQANKGKKETAVTSIIVSKNAAKKDHISSVYTNGNIVSFVMTMKNLSTL